jgi:hypothetical protein
VEFALDYAQFLAVHPLTAAYEDLKRQQAAMEVSKSGLELQRENLNKKITDSWLRLRLSDPFRLKEEWNHYLLETAVRSEDPQAAWEAHRQALDTKIDELQRQFGFQLSVDDPDFDHRFRRFVQQRYYPTRVRYNFQKTELENLMLERRSLPKDPVEAWKKALDERIALLDRVVSQFSNDPEVNGHGDLDAVVAALHELGRQKNDPAYRMPIKTRSKIAIVLGWAGQVEDFKKSGDPLKRPFNLLDLLEAKDAADQREKKGTSSIP